MESENIDVAKAYWDNANFEKIRDVSWLGIPYVKNKIDDNFKKSLGASTVQALFVKRMGPELVNKLRGVAIVCGDMKSEEGLFSPVGNVRFSEVIGYDLSPESLLKYKTEAFKFYPRELDCNNLVLPPHSADLIVGSHGVHHVFNLGNLFYQSYLALSENGLIYLSEWIGPEYLQIPKSNKFIAILLLHLLFPSRKKRRSHDGRTKGRYFMQFSPEAFDPSEACNSTEILPQYLKYFRPLTMIKFGGLSYPVFEGLARNFDEKNFFDNLKIRLVYYTEVVLTKFKVIRPLFMMTVGEKKPGLKRPKNLES